ncbi:MAG: hypothetical protein JWO06_3167 [Bacteroidota bacterium]|nr:hypothetical protein [Bacteroidota bacterium]
MKNQIFKLLFYVSAFFVFSTANAQDKIYKSDGTVYDGKVTEIGPTQIHFTVPGGPEYTLNQRDLDSVVYSNGRHEKMGATLHKKNLHENIPQLNTWTFDVLGFAFLSVSQSYERRLKNGKIGFRVPLYIGFIGGGLAGVGTFLPGTGVYYPYTSTYATNGAGYINNNGFSIATGFNPKFYLFKRRIIRVFAGPELDLGYSRITVNNYIYDNTTYNYIYGPSQTYYCGTAALLASFGLNINPIDKFNITIHGAAGGGDVFGSHNPVGWTGVWQIGLSMGTNF